MDPIGAINIKKDSTYAMLREAQARGFEIHYFELGDLFLHGEIAQGRSRRLTIHEDRSHWFDLGDESELRLGDLDVILMRKDPPFDMEYVYSTYMLEQAERQGAMVVNKPRALRDLNEKLAVLLFPQCIVPSVMTRKSAHVRRFLAEQGDIILKPLHGMGGLAVFRLRQGDPNTNVVLETVTNFDSRFVVAQRFIPEIRDGDKRILLIDGEPVPYALARLPAEGETRANLAAGGRGEGRPLTARDRWICEQVGPLLRERGVMFAGIDVIGDYLTEINITSPTGIRELDTFFGLNIAGLLLDAITANRSAR